VEDLIKVIIAVVFIVASIYSELRKNKDTTQAGNDTPDLGTLNDFFKKKVPKDPQTSASDDFSTRPSPLSRLETWGQDSAQMGEIRPTFESFPPIPVDSGTLRKAKKKKSKPVSRSMQPQHASCLDEGPTLTGKVDYDRTSSLEAPIAKRESLSGKVDYERDVVAIKRTSSGQHQMVRRTRKKWTHKQLIDAIMLSELLTRYDLNRIYSRIPNFRAPD